MTPPKQYLFTGNFLLIFNGIAVSFILPDAALNSTFNLRIKKLIPILIWSFHIYCLRSNCFRWLPKEIEFFSKRKTGKEKKELNLL
jgi:hypothetical protein